MKPFSFFLACTLAACLTISSFGQTESVSDIPAKRKEKPVQVTKERKQELIAFVTENHLELKELLLELEGSEKKRPYRQAMSGLDKAVKKLEGIKQRSPKRYDSALQQWKLESRIKVAGAQVKLNDNEETRSQLKSLATQLFDFHIQRLKNERERIRQRLEQVDTKIAEAEANRVQTIEKRITSATRRGKNAKKQKE